MKMSLLVISLAACLPGTYGDRCEQDCKCGEGEPCYHITGDCRCPPGYNGPSCEQRMCLIYFRFSVFRPVISDVCSAWKVLSVLV